MRVLVLNGSPKGDKSNTYRLTSAFLDGLRQTQPVEAETIEVGKLHLLPCRGCFACWSKTPGKCVLQDDMAGVIEKILAADVLIWSFSITPAISSCKTHFPGVLLQQAKQPRHGRRCSFPTSRTSTSVCCT